MQSSFTPPASSPVRAPSLLQKTDAFTAAGDSAWHAITGLTGLVVTTTTATQKILLIPSIMCAITGTGYGGGIRVTRNGTVVAQGDAVSSHLQVLQGNISATGNGLLSFSIGCPIFDAPAAAGTYTYQVEYICETGGDFFCNRSLTDSDDIEGARGVSTLLAVVFEP